MKLLPLLVLFAPMARLLAGEVLIVADEFPAMEVVAAKLKSEEKVTSRLINQKELPADLKPFDAVVVYIHGALSPSAENAFIDYAKAGGKLVLLHHSISSGKRKNAKWFSFLGVSLPEGEVGKGGYKWIEGVSISLVNLAARHFIMTNSVHYPEDIAFASTNASRNSKSLAGFTLKESEVYLNHVHTEPRTLLMGIKYAGTNGVTWMQDTAGWLKAAGKGTVVYLMPGHTKHDFENPVYGRIVVNAIIFKPSKVSPAALN